MHGGFFLILFGLIFLINISTVQLTWCPLPASLKRNYDFDWDSRSQEWTNKNASVDYLAFVLSWSPTFCEGLPKEVRQQKFQCIHVNHFQMIVHGLWPQTANVNDVRDHPRNCRNDPQLNATLIKRYFCLLPDEELIQGQWEKHGSCHFESAAQYFSTIEKLYQNLRIPDFQSFSKIDAIQVRDAFLQKNPKLFGSAIQVMMKSENVLREIKICFSLDYQITKCRK